MDIDATLAQIRELVVSMSETAEVGSEGFELAERVAALDVWMSKGGCMPREWFEVSGLI